MTYIGIIIIIAALGTIALFSLAAFDSGDEHLAMITFLIIVSLMTVMGIGFKEKELSSEFVIEQQIVSLNYETELSGTFVLATGRISEKQYYYVYTKNTNKHGLVEYKLEKLEVSITIIEDNTLTPGIYTDKSKNNLEFFGLRINTYETKGWSNYLVIPEGSIIKEFSPN